MEIEVPSDPSLSLLSSSKNVSRNVTNIIPPPSSLQDRSELWPDTVSDSSKKNSKFNLSSLRILCSSKCPNQNLLLSDLKPQFTSFWLDTESRKTSTPSPSTPVCPKSEDVECLTSVGSGKRTSVSVNKCRIRRKEFKTTSALKTQLLIHRQDGPHFCGVCQRAFKHHHQL